jgi:uncharacterized membrane protein
MTETDTKTTGREPEEVDPIRFDAVLHPNASLSPRGFFLLMAVVGLVSFCAGISFVIAGAWPVFGFFGIDIVLVYLAFKLNYRDARRYETIRLTDSTLVVERFNPSGRRERWRFQPYWLKVDVENDPVPGSTVTLRSHGRNVEIGSFLSPEERLDFANALRAELAKIRD